MQPGDYSHLWPRLLPLAAGPAMIAAAGLADPSSNVVGIAVVAGTAISLLGVLAMLPWLIQLAVRRLRPTRPAWQLAIGRLHLDSATPARVVGGLAVVLSGAIALQTVLLGAQTAVNSTSSDIRPNQDPVAALVNTSSTVAVPIADEARSVDGVTSVTAYSYLDVETTPPTQNFHFVTVADCATIRQWLRVSRCDPGDAFHSTQSSPPRPGTRVTLTPSPTGIGSPPRESETVSVGWTVPRTRPATPEVQRGLGTVVTPAALPARLPGLGTTMHVHAPGPASQAVLERLRASLADYRWRVHIAEAQTRNQRLYAQIRAALLAAALLPLGLAGISLLALAGEQIRERRRPLAVLAATGIPRAVLARSLLWQQLLPTLLAMALAAATGTGLGVLVTNLLIGGAPHIDWTAIAVFTTTGILMALTVTLLTLPTLRAATHHQALQTE